MWAAGDAGGDGDDAWLCLAGIWPDASTLFLLIPCLCSPRFGDDADYLFVDAL